MPTKIVKYTGDTDERIEDNAGLTLVDVGPNDRLEEVGASIADWLVSTKPDWEYYNGSKTVGNDSFTGVDGRSINPDSVTTDSIDTERLSNVHTYIVTPSNSLDINDVVDNQLSAGESIWLSGTHTVTKDAADALTLSQNNVSIEGTGTLKLEDSAGSDTANNDDESILAITGDDVTVRGIGVDGNKANQSPGSNADRITGIRPGGGCTDWTIDNVHVHDCTNGGIKHNGNDLPGNDGEITNCEVNDCTRDAIFIGGERVRGAGNYVHDIANQDGIEPLGDYQTWENNVVVNTAGSAFDCFGVDGVSVTGNIALVGDNGPSDLVSFNGPGGSEADRADGCVATGNVFIGSGITGASFVGDHLASFPESRGCVVTDNISWGASRRIFLDHDWDVTLRDNEFIDGGANDIVVREGSVGAEGHVVIEGNTSRGCGQDFVEIESGAIGVTVRNNTSINAGSVGIQCQGADARIEGNTVKSPSVGCIYVNGGKSGNQIIGNDCYGGGIVVQNEDDVRVCQNRVRDSDGNGINMNETDAGTHTNIHVKYNRVDNASSRGLQFGGGGWDKVYIEGNSITNSGTQERNYGISGVYFVNGTAQVSGAPSAANYDGNDAGMKVLDTSVSPADVYYVLQDGTLTGAT